MEIEDDEKLIFKLLQVRSQKFMLGPHIFISNNNKVPLMAAFIYILNLCITEAYGKPIENCKCKHPGNGMVYPGLHANVNMSICDIKIFCYVICLP